MNFLEELLETIEFLYKNDPETKQALLALDPDTIRKMGAESQAKIAPEDVIDALDAGDEGLKYLRRKAERQIAQKKLYKDLCKEYAIKIKNEKKKNRNDEVEI